MKYSLKLLAINVVVWFIGALLLILVILITIIAALFSPIFECIFFSLGKTKSIPSYSSSVNNLEQLELRAIEEFVLSNKTISYDILKGDCILEDLTFLDSSDHKNSIKYHVVVFKSASVKSRVSGKILLVHGVLSHPLGWKPIIPCLVDLGYEVYCVGLPGFGYVKEPAYVWGFAPNECDKWLDFYGEYLKRLILLLFPFEEKPLIMGHSFGGNVTSHFCYCNPDMFKKLILVNTMSFLPTLHVLTPFWAIFFNHIPFYLFRALGRMLNVYLFQLAYSSDNTYMYMLNELALLTCAENYGNIIASRFICIEAIDTYWRGPYVFNRLLRVAHKTVGICTIGDTISPAYNYKMFFDVARNSSTSLYVINGSDHNPIRVHTEDFLVCLRHALSDDREECVKKSVAISDEKIDDVLDKYGWSAYEISQTKRNIQEEYKILRTMYGCATPFSNYYKVSNGLLKEENDSVCFGACMPNI